MPDGYNIYTPKAIAGSYFGLKISTTGGEVGGAGDILVRWQRQVTPIKLPSADPNVVQLIIGKLEGSATVRSYAAYTDINPTTILTNFGGAPSGTTTVSVTAGTGNVSFTGYATGNGFEFARIASRCWTLKSGAVVKLIA